jgi:hypothetical protein
MKLRRVLVAVLVALLAVGVAPLPSAYAGGPTSVLMVNPNREQARAAYASDSVYTALAAGVGEGQTGSSGPPPGIAEGSEEVRLTWLIHDMQIWRIDRIHLTSADGMWIETVVDSTRDGQMLERPAFWHRPADASTLTAVLAEVGLLGDSGVAPANPSAPGAEATLPAPPSAIPGLAAAALVGLVLGAAGTLVGVRARTRTPADRPERVTLSG